MTFDQALNALADHRRDIDRIDLDILRLLNDRTRVVEKIGNIKEEFAMPIYEPKREDEVYRNVLEHNAGPLPPEAVKRIFERLIDEMRTLQSIKLNRDRDGAVRRTEQ
jgi:chorismate mutase